MEHVTMTNLRIIHSDLAPSLTDYKRVDFPDVSRPLHTETPFFNPLNFVVDNLERLGFLDGLDSFPFETFTVQIKRGYQSTSQRPSSRMGKQLLLLT